MKNKRFARIPMREVRGTRERALNVRNCVISKRKTWMKNSLVSNYSRKKPPRLLICIIFIILFLFGVSNLTEYGKPIDEHTEQDILLSNIKEYSAIIGNQLQDPAFSEIKQISVWKEKDHGIACFYPFTPVLLALRQTDPLKCMYLWHLYIYLLWFLGVLALYVLLKEIFHHRWTPIAGTLCYFFTPRIYAEGHYNNKDIIFLTLIIIMLCFAVRTVKYYHIKDIILFSIVSGLLMNIKILGVAIWGLTGIFMILHCLVFKNKNNRHPDIASVESEKKHGFLSAYLGLTAVLPAAAFSFVFFVIFTPAMIRDPFGYLVYTFSYTARFTRWGGSYLFHGKQLFPDVTGVPRTYVPEWIMMTTPIFILVLFICSVFFFAFHITKRKVFGRKNPSRKPVHNNSRSTFLLKEREFFYLLFLLTFLFPLIYSVIKADSIIFYNGWRHNYYLYVYIILCASYTLDCVFGKLSSGSRRSIKQKQISAIICALCTICFFITVFDMIRHRSFEYVYFNPASRVLTDINGFEGDYWNVSEKAALIGLSNQLESENKKIDVVALDDAGKGQQELIGIEYGNVRLASIGTPTVAGGYYLFNVSKIEDLSVLDGYTQVFAINQYGRDLCAIYIRNQQP